MKNANEFFIIEGLKRYKQANIVYNTFRRELQNKLQSILKKRTDWGMLKPNMRSVKSTNFGQDYPLINGRIDCQIQDKLLTIVLAVNWYQSDTDTPLFSLWVEPEGDLLFKMEQYNWSSPYEFSRKQLIIQPDADNFDIDKEFNMLIDEFIRFLEGINYDPNQNIQV